MAGLTLDAAAALAVDATWKGKINAAMTRAAAGVIQTILAGGPPYTNVDQAKVVRARQVLRDVTQYGADMAWLLAADTTIDPSTVTDAALVTRITQLWVYISETGFGIQ